MAWTQEPDEASIQYLIDITAQSFGREEAIARLKGNELDVGRAANEFYDNPTGGSKYKWDDSVWSADRDGGQNAAGVQFNVQGPDVTTSHFDTTSTAPTRPPSRANNRSPMGAPTTQADEDADLQRALAESAAESGLPPQESGIIGSDLNETKFGPATRSEYEQDQWAMVPTKAFDNLNSQQKPVIPPSGRKRNHPAPAFLQAGKDHRLGAIITILSHIPMAKNALLSSGDTPRSYGYENDWWEGKSIVPQGGRQSEHLSLDVETRHNDAFSIPHPDFYEELHRLIAFLDTTDRAYGSADSLAVSSALDPDHGAGRASVDTEEAFFAALKTEFEETGNMALKPFMSIARTERAKKSATVEQDDEDSGETALFDFLTIPLADGQNQSVTSLYNALDTIFWTDAFCQDQFPNADSNMAFLQETGGILAIRIGGDGLCKPCDIPLTLYLDRYMESRRDTALHIQEKLHILRSALRPLDGREQKVLACNGETDCGVRNWFDGKPHASRDCWEKTINEAAGLIVRQHKLAQLRHTEQQLAKGIPPTLESIALIHSGDCAYELSTEEQQLQKLGEDAIQLARAKLDRIDSDLDDIKHRRERLTEGIDHFSVRLTIREDEAPQEFVDKYIVPDRPQVYKPDQWNPTHRFLLSGVATTNEITYVCTRRARQLVEVGDQTEPLEQWWRLVYAAQEKNPISIEKTDAESVSIAAGSESKHPIMIYASEAALGAEPMQLSQALRTFVRADNKVFQNELSMEQSGPTPLTAETIDAIPEVSYYKTTPAMGKRKSSVTSSNATIDSMDTRDMDMPFTDPVTSYQPNEQEPMTWTQDSDLNTEPPKVGRLRKSMEDLRCQDSTAQATDVDMEGAGEGIAKSPEMQERTGGPSPFMMHRPIEKASQATSSSADLMDMDLEAEVEHHEGH